MFSPFDNLLDVKDNNYHQISRFFCCNKSKESEIKNLCSVFNFPK